MFVFQERLKVNPYRQSELVARQHWIHGLMQPNPGFVGAQLARFLGNATDYLVLRAWRDEASMAAFRATEAGANYGKNRPEGLFDGLSCARRHLSSVETSGSGSGNLIVRRHYAVDPQHHEAFVRSRERHDAAVAQAPGTVYLHTLRCIDTEGDGQNTFLGIARYESRDAYNAYLQSAPLAAYRREESAGLYTILEDELYEVVDEVRP